MVKIEKGGEYTANTVRSGENSRGPWELVVVKAEGRARQKITIFPTNYPTGIQEGENFIIKEITGVVVKQKQDSNGGWTLMDTNVYAELERLQPADLDNVSTTFDDIGGSFDDIDALF